MIREEQRATIKEQLLHKGLTFKPLQEEMIDHICCDLEEKITSGLSFDEALRNTMSDIPEDHFRIIQKRTMDTINRRFVLSQGLSYAALGSLLCSLTFKILHLQFTDSLLILSFLLIAASLLVSAISGIYRNKDKKGALSVLAVIIGTVTLLSGYTFRILRLPGADPIIGVAVTVLAISLLANTFLIYRTASGKGNLLTYLHEKYTPGIERFLMLSLLPITLYKVVTIVNPQYNFLGGLILLIVIFGGGIQFVALTWRKFESDASHRTPYKLGALIISLMCLVLVYLGNLIPFEVRVLMIALYSAVTAWLAFNLEEPKTIPHLILASLVPLLFFGWAIVKLQIVPTEVNRFVFNLPVLLLLVLGLFLCKKNEPMRAYMIVSLSSYVFEYAA
jgi:hypothetical protein